MSKPTILIVDDDPTNLNVLSQLLAPSYRVLACKSGEQALHIVCRHPKPDLVLLNIMMPGMDGYEVLSQMRHMEEAENIPVIFVTGLSETQSEEKGLRLGAVDYITKPINPAILKARVQNTLDLKKYRDHLEALVEERTRELSEANSRLEAIKAAQQDYLHAISHELRTPMNGIMGVAELALAEWDDEEHKTYKRIFQESRARLLTALDSALMLGELQGEAQEMETMPVPLGEMVSSVCRELKEDFSQKHLSLQVEEDCQEPVLANLDFLRQSLVTLFKGVLRLADPGTQVDIRYDRDPEKAILRLCFHCPPFPDRLKASLFDTFSVDRCCSPVEDLGLSLPLAAHLVASMGGSLEILERPLGMEFQMALRKCEQG